ncbi:MAG: fibrillarin-like rRNA/tRNA 2'-O-methyltransferase [Candidatus Heimdallarchaeaceae archaeon]
MSSLRPHNFPELFWIKTRDGNTRLATRNADPGKKVYTERLITIHGVEYRTFDPYKSKLAAAILKNMKELPITRGKDVLYLGAASGTTVSHISDILGDKGQIFAVEFSSRSITDLVAVSERRKNIIPIHADARFPEEYSFIVPLVDIIYEDVAQPFQAEILIKNVETYLKEDGFFFLAVKARSIDVTKDPKYIFKKVKEKLQSSGLEILEMIDLEPYEKDHVMIVGKMKS